MHLIGFHCLGGPGFSKRTVNSRNAVSQQILAAVTTRIVVDKNTDYAYPHSICFLAQYQR